MLWIIPAWVLSLIAIYFLGYYFRGITKKIAELEEVIQSKVDRKPVVEEPSSTILDPNDPVQEAIYQHKIMMEKLNGK
ncbi:hypothetical protein UFOVP253_30 [uncultured Caudovirales phage]|uniref:Uncharacterized protein n=1 Tax=uncultured Caudovirales phage TaxID=2100421 RepID=A0A6J5LGY5_9CAUD|nr:hypothetical protein UFOVP253_30 [uncultured Caudovirales phage]